MMVVVPVDAVVDVVVVAAPCDNILLGTDKDDRIRLLLGEDQVEKEGRSNGPDMNAFDC